jgi:hypothetical protein
LHIRKGEWFRAVVKMLTNEGFRKGGEACPKLVTSYWRAGVFVEIRGGCSLHIIQKGRRVRHENVTIDDAKDIIVCAKADGDYLSKN